MIRLYTGRLMSSGHLKYSLYQKESMPLPLQKNTRCTTNFEALDGRWFLYEAEKKEAVEKYCSFVRYGHAIVGFLLCLYGNVAIIVCSLFRDKKPYCIKNFL